MEREVVNGRPSLKEIRVPKCPEIALADAIKDNSKRFDVY